MGNIETRGPSESLTGLESSEVARVYKYANGELVRRISNNGGGKVLFRVRDQIIKDDKVYYMVNVVRIRVTYPTVLDRLRVILRASAESEERYEDEVNNTQFVPEDELEKM
jgi:hypothetical protein